MADEGQGTVSTSQAGDAHRPPVLDAVLLTVGTLLAIFSAAVLVAQYRPVLFRHDTAFIGLSLAILAACAALVGFRAGRRAAERDAPRLLRTAFLSGTVVVGFAASACVAAVGWYRIRDGIGWPRVELGVLVVLVGGCAFVAVLVGGWTHRWGMLAWCVGAGLCVGALVAAAVASWVLDNDFSDRKADQCTARGTVTYCHYPGFEPFVDEWAPVVEAVLAGAPGDAARRPVTVQQATKSDKSYIGGTRPAGAGVVPLLEWSPGNTAPFALAIDTANWVTGRVLVPEHDTTLQIVVDGGGRGVVTYWLAAQATARSRRAFEYHFYDCGGGAVSGNDYDAAVLPADGARGDPAGPDRYAAALLKDPDARRKVREHWAELTRPDTTAIQAGLILEIEPEPAQSNRCESRENAISGGGPTPSRNSTT